MSAQLFEPIVLRGLKVPHRLWVSPMCQYSAVDGVAQDWHLAHLGSFAIGRAGLIITEATAVNAIGRISPRDVGIWTDEQAQAWSRIAHFSHSQGVPMGIQLAHAGRKASTASPYEGRGPVHPDDGGWGAVAPSALAFGSLPNPHQMTEGEIESVVEDFASASQRSVAAGFDAIEIHAAHGYLIHEFLSPLANQRTDKYGGSFNNRVRFLLDIVRRVRSVITDSYPLFVRISATDWVEGGWTGDESVELSVMLEQLGVDLIDVSSAGLSGGQEIPVGPGYQVPFARAIKQRVNVSVGTVGLVTAPSHAEAIVLERSADVVMVARQFLREPMFALRAAAELGGNLDWPQQYAMAKFPGSIP